MFFRSIKTLQDKNDQGPDSTFMKEEKSYFFLVAAIMVIASGCFCLFLDENWTRNFSSFLKVPIYIIVAQSLTYLITFGILDFSNYLVGYFQSANSLSLVETQDQIIALLVSCFAAGMFYGMIFGLMDIEDKSRFWEMRKSFFYEERLCVPIGILSGCAAGFCNELLRNNVSNS